MSDIHVAGATAFWDKRGAFGVETNASPDGVQMVRFYLVWRSPAHLELIELLRDVDPKAVQIKSESAAIKGGHHILAAPTPPQVASVVVWKDWAGEETFDAVIEMLNREGDQ